MRTLSLALVLAALSTAATAQAYRWVDENGKVHYGDRPPSTASNFVRGTRNVRPSDDGPITPGMTPDEVRNVFGKPDDVRTVMTRMGQVQYWNYRKPPKGQKTAYTVKFEGGTVSEVTTEPVAPSPLAPAGPSPGAAPSVAVGAGTLDPSSAAPSQQAQQQASAAAARERQCTQARESMANIDSRMRVGGSAQAMERMRDERRRYEQKASELGC